MPPSVRGAAGATARSKPCTLLPLSFVAVTVTVAMPVESGVTVSRPPDCQRCTTPPGTVVTS